MSTVISILVTYNQLLLSQINQLLILNLKTFNLFFHRLVNTILIYQ